MCQIYQAIHGQNKAKLRCGRIEYKFNQNSILYLISSKCSESVTCKLKIQSQSDPILASRSTKKTPPSINWGRTKKNRQRWDRPQSPIVRPPSSAASICREESQVLQKTSLKSKNIPAIISTLPEEKCFSPESPATKQCRLLKFLTLVIYSLSRYWGKDDLLVCNDLSFQHGRTELKRFCIDSSHTIGILIQLLYKQSLHF